MSTQGERKKDKLDPWILSIFYTLEFGDKQVLWTWNRLLETTTPLEVKCNQPFKDQRKQN